MEFICVLSVNDSLASYFVSQVSPDHYKAVLKGSGVERKDLPATLTIQKKEDKWISFPLQEEVSAAIIHAIEAGI